LEVLRNIRINQDRHSSHIHNRIKLAHQINYRHTQTRPALYLRMHSYSSRNMEFHHSFSSPLRQINQNGVKKDRNEKKQQPEIFPTTEKPIFYRLFIAREPSLCL